MATGFAHPRPHEMSCSSITELVSAYAVSQPDAIAVRDSGRVLTYGELDACTNELSNQLRDLGVGADIVAAVCFPRSVAMIVAALATLKADGAYLPLDPAYPLNRLSFFLNDAQPRVLITDSCFASRLSAPGCHVICLDGSLGISTQVNPQAFTSRPPEKATQESLAYVIYTSGSTGQPKGVEIERTSLENLVRWHKQAFSVSATDRATLIASPAFDASVWELWPYLTSGASVHIPPADVRMNPALLQSWLLDQEITIAFVPTPMVELLMRMEWLPSASVRFLLTGGDTLRIAPSPKLPFTVVNNYGPTECSVVSTSAIVSPTQASELPPIGRPIENVSVYILDESLQKVPTDAEGEIYVGGVGVARGYRNRPDLTAERFLADPFSPVPRARMYRTGDRGRFLPDGQVAFLGRNDDQIKIRGYRIEPNEIVSALNTHPAVNASFVTAKRDQSGDLSLIAYVVPEEATQLTDQVLREFLANQIPDFMVPAVFVRLESLPVTASGKIDRHALPTPVEANIISDEKHIAPRSPIEQSVASLLTTLLRCSRISVHDDFFFLGGNSLLGAQVIARVRDRFGVELSLLALFDHPTVAELSAEIERLIVEKIESMPEQEAQSLLSMISSEM